MQGRRHEKLLSLSTESYSRGFQTKNYDTIANNSLTTMAYIN
jgi:hypothetical protein